MLPSAPSTWRRRPPTGRWRCRARRRGQRACRCRRWRAACRSLRGWGLWVGEMIEVDEDGADDVGPFLAGGDAVVGAAAVVAGGPVIEDDGQVCARAGRGEVVDEVEALRAADDVLSRGVDEVDAHVVLGRGPSPGLELVHGGVVAVLVLDGVFVEASGEEGLLLGVYGELFGRVAFEWLRSLSTDRQSKVGFMSWRMKRLSPSPARG